MKEYSRRKNLKLNIIFGYIAQIGIIVLSFLGRRIFLHFLPADYLGINGLYTNILTILSLAELGLDTAVVYTLYKPVAEHNTQLTSSLLSFFKKIYFAIATSIFVIGLALIPFLKYLISSDIGERDLIFYYILFLINTVASYFIAHKVALLSASQEQRVQKLVTLFFNFFLQIVHICVLIVCKNYYFYIISTVLTTILTNIVLGILTNKLHPEIFKEKNYVDFEKKPIIEKIFSTFLYKLGVVLINSTDNILISVLVGTAAVGIYSNYSTTISAIAGFISILTVSLIAGIGNFAVQGKQKEQCELFDMMLLLYHIVASLGFIGFSFLFNDFITLWLGSGYLLAPKTVFVIAFNFYLNNATAPVWMFREANGLFTKVRFLLLIRAFINMVLSIWWGVLWGMAGILLATAASFILTNFWFEPRILSCSIFMRPQRVYWCKQLKWSLTTALCYIICAFVFYWMGNSIYMFILKVVIVCVITGGMFLVSNMQTSEFKGLKNYFIK